MEGVSPSNEENADGSRLQYGSKSEGARIVKTTFNAIAATAALAVTLGLGACGGQAASSSTSAASTSSEATSSAAVTSEATTSAAATSSASASSVSPEEVLISWQGALEDGTLVDFINSEDGTNGGFVLTKSNAEEPQRWLGAMTTTADGKITITDDTSKESISFTLTELTDDGAVVIEVEGYGKGALVPMTAADWQRVAEAEEYAKALGTTVNTFGAFEDGTLMFYTENTEGTDAAVVIMPAGTTEMKTWTGKATTAEDGKETVTDDQTKETFSYTWTDNNDGTQTIVADGYGKATLVKMTVGDWAILDELAKSM